MRTKTPAEELKKGFNSQEIGKRILDLMKIENMTLKKFATIIKRVPYAPFVNLERFKLQVRVIDAYDNGRLSHEAICGKIGDFFLDFAFSSYIVAMALKTDPTYLAFGHESHFGKIYQVKQHEPWNEDEYLFENLKILINPSEISSRIKEIRNISGKNSRETAKAIRVSLVTYLGYENADETTPQRFSFPVFFELCRFLNVELDYLILGKPISAFYQPRNFEMAKGYNNILGYCKPSYSIKERYMEEIEEQQYCDKYILDTLEIDDDITTEDISYSVNAKLKRLNGQERAKFLKTALLLFEESEKEFSNHRSIRHLNEAVELIKSSMKNWTSEDLIVIREMAEKWYIPYKSEEKKAESYNPPDYNNIPAMQAIDASKWIMENLINMPAYAIGMIQNILW